VACKVDFAVNVRCSTASLCPQPKSTGLLEACPGAVVESDLHDSLSQMDCQC
jgi:hypothetical protein